MQCSHRFGDPIPWAGESSPPPSHTLSLLPTAPPPPRSDVVPLSPAPRPDRWVTRPHPSDPPWTLSWPLSLARGGVPETALPSPQVEGCPSSLGSQERVWAAPASTYPPNPAAAHPPSPQPSSGSVQASRAVTRGVGMSASSHHVGHWARPDFAFVSKTEIFIWDFSCETGTCFLANTQKHMQ